MKELIKYEVERINTDTNGTITYADSWGKESTLCDSYEEALETADKVDARGYDEVLINKLTLEYDEEWDEIIEATDSEQLVSFKVNDRGFIETEEAR